MTATLDPFVLTPLVALLFTSVAKKGNLYRHSCKCVAMQRTIAWETADCQSGPLTNAVHHTATGEFTCLTPLITTAPDGELMQCNNR